MGMVHSELKSTREYKHCYTAGKRNLAKWQVESNGLDQVTRGERQVKEPGLVWVLRSGEWGGCRGEGFWQGREWHEPRWEPPGTVRTSRCWGDPSFLLEGDAQGEDYALHNMACAPSCRGPVVSPVDLPRAGLCALSLWAYVS